MSLNCFCVRSGADQVYKVRVQLLDNTVSEYSLSKPSTGEECVRKVASEADLKEIAYFGLKYGSNGTSEKWLSLNENLQKQIQKFRKDSKDEVLLYFKIRFFATQVDWLTEDTTRYFYYLQLRQNINDGILDCNEQEAIVLASYALQVEYGDYDSSEHTDTFIEEYQLLPVNLTTKKSNSELYNEISAKHAKYIGMATTDAEFAYIKYARTLGGYGHEFYPAKDNEGRPVEIGPCARGISLKYDSETPITYFDWQDIVEMTHSKRLFAVKTNNLKSVVEMESPEDAKYVWQMCVDHHQFYRIADHNRNSISSEHRNTPRQTQRPPSKRHSNDAETLNGFAQANDGLVNPGFNDSMMEDRESDAPESKRTSRESGIYGSAGSQSSPLQKSEIDLCNGERSTSCYNEHNDDIPAELMMASYKTFETAKDKRLNEHIDPMTRRSYPRAVAPRHHTDGAGVLRSTSMIEPTALSGDNHVDSCSVRTVGTSGYSTSTDSGLYNTRSPTSPVSSISPMSPVSLLSSGSFVYEDYEIPSFDEQCKQLEVAVCEGRLDQEFSQIMLKDEKKTTATGQLPINRTKNRYADILPYEDSRIRLSSSSDSSDSDYINASFIKVKVSTKSYNYIATQAPLDTTVADFWQMIWEQNVKMIVMLYNRGDGPHACHRYWPKYKKGSGLSSRMLYDKFEVSTQFINQSGCYKSSGLNLLNKTENKERTIIHLQFLQWPDNGIPADPTAFLEFIAEVDSIRNNFEVGEEERSPTVVHCCAGVGRTGVFILADLMIAYLQNPTRQPFNVPRILTKLRSQRMSLIRTVDQYRFVYNLLIHYLKNSRLI